MTDSKLQRTLIDSIIKIIDDNEEFIVENYNGRENQVLLKYELKRKILIFVNSLKDKSIDKKELVKYAIREAFELLDSDIIMIKKDSIFIKLFDLVKKHEVKDTEKDTILNRYDGIEEHELDAFYNEHFKNKENEDFFILVAQIFVNKCFLEQKISNLDYEKYAFSYIQLIITEELLNKFDYSEEFFKGFAGYIFRIHFREVFEHITEIVLSEISISNQYMIEFLKYYSLNIIVYEGKKYQVPSLEAENGLRWNVVSMLSIVKLYVKTNSASKIVQYSINKKKEEIKELYIDELSPVEYNNQLTDEQNELTADLSKNEENLEKNCDLLKFVKNEDRKSILKLEVEELKTEIQYIKEDKANLLKDRISSSKINNYLLLVKELEFMLMQLRKESKVLDQNAKAFMSIKNALVKALTSKKQLL